MPDLLQRKWDELLPAEPGIHAHYQNMVHHGQNVDQQIDPRGWIDHDRRLHSMLLNQFQRAMQMAACFIMHAHPIRSRLRQRGDKLVRVLNHQMAIERQIGHFAQRRNHGRTHRNVGHEMPIHHIHMDDSSAAPLRGLNLLGQVGKVCGKN